MHTHHKQDTTHHTPHTTHTTHTTHPHHTADTLETPNTPDTPHISFNTAPLPNNFRTIRVDVLGQPRALEPKTLSVQLETRISNPRPLEFRPLALEPETPSLHCRYIYPSLSAKLAIRDAQNALQMYTVSIYMHVLIDKQKK